MLNTSAGFVIAPLISLLTHYFLRQPVGLGAIKLDSRKMAPLPTLTLTLSGTLAAALDNNPDVQLYKERIEAAQGRCKRSSARCCRISLRTSDRAGKHNFLARLAWHRCGPTPSAFPTLASPGRKMWLASA